MEFLFGCLARFRIVTGKLERSQRNRIRVGDGFGDGFGIQIIGEMESLSERIVEIGQIIQALAQRFFGDKIWQLDDNRLIPKIVGRQFVLEIPTLNRSWWKRSGSFSWNGLWFFQSGFQATQS